MATPPKRLRRTMTRSRLLIYSLILAVAVVLVSCNRKNVYVKYQHVPTSGWDKNDTLTYDVSPLKAGRYREEVGVRIARSYPFMSLSLVVKQTILPSGYVHSDTLVCKLVDESGKFRGQGVSYYQQTFHLNTIRLHEGDSLHINIKHNMKREVMLGVSDIGFRIDKE